MPYRPKNNWQPGNIITKGKMDTIEDNIQDLIEEVTGARTYNGEVSGTLGARLDDMIIVSDTQPNTPNNEIWFDINKDLAITEIPIMQDLHNLESSIADAGVYTQGNSYAVGDYVYYNESLYQCNTTIANAGKWDSSEWNNVNLSDVIHANATAIESLSEQQAFIATYGTTTTAEIYAAKTAGKQIFANKNGIYYPLVEGGQTSAGPSEYALLDGNVAKVLLLTSPSMWTSASLALAGIDHPVMDSPKAVATPTISSNNTLLATTEFVQRAIALATGSVQQETFGVKNRLDNGTDLNTVTDSGVYLLGSNAGYVNAPSGLTYGFLTVKTINAITCQTVETPSATYTRFYDGSAWNAWR